MALERIHEPTTCHYCGDKNVPVYELKVPRGLSGSSMGALHLAAHQCPNGGDHACIQRAASLKQVHTQER